MVLFLLLLFVYLFSVFSLEAYLCSPCLCKQKSLDPVPFDSFLTREDYRDVLAYSEDFLFL